VKGENPFAASLNGRELESGLNGIAALTFCEVPLETQKAISPRKTARLATSSPPSSDTAPPWVQDALPDDLVPSLPPDWKPPTCST
jgi:hypothetical protein